MEKEKINKKDTNLLLNITDLKNLRKGAYNIRKNGHRIEAKVTENINIVPKKDKPGIDIYVKENAKGEVHIPVILTESGMEDLVYNDFYIGENADVLIVAGCGIHNDGKENSKHDGIHRFFVERNAKVKYIEKHYGEGEGYGKKILNPVTEVTLKENSSMDMETVQIRGVDSTIRKTMASLESNANLVISEKILTSGKQRVETIFDIKLYGENSSAHVVSRSVAEDKSIQHFKSNITGNSKCFAHSECDAIIKDGAKVTATPKIVANSVDARLIHEAAIGKIAGEQLIKLRTLGLTEKEAEEEIIKGFLKVN